MPSQQRVIQESPGAVFLIGGEISETDGSIGKNLLSLSSWRPYPLPGGAVIPVGLQCERVRLLLQCYVHPMKNYIPNGEVLLHYADGPDSIESLVPPYNLDCYFQHFSRKGTPIPFGRLTGGGFVDMALSQAHADVLDISCDPTRSLKSVELRATCSEGLIGLAGMTVIHASAQH
jgi:hypothetical protein